MGFFHDGSGALSSARLVMILWSLGLLTTWVVLCVWRKEMVEIPAGVVGVHGSIIAGKVVQAFSANDQAPK